MRFVFTRHARERCRQRGIRLQHVRSVITSPDHIRLTASGAIEAVKKVGVKRLAVLFQVQKDIRTVITAYYED